MRSSTSRWAVSGRRRPDSARSWTRCARPGPLHARLRAGRPPGHPRHGHHTTRARPHPPPALRSHRPGRGRPPSRRSWTRSCRTTAASPSPAPSSRAWPAPPARPSRPSTRSCAAGTAGSPSTPTPRGAPRARAARERELFVLGDGGVGTALRAAGRGLGPRAALPAPRLPMPSGSPSPAAGCGPGPSASSPRRPLRFQGARVAVIAYGAPPAVSPPRSPAAGVHPVLLGAAWFIAQARKQRALWESAT